ncbi:TPA: DNA-directed RNA polymerase subunit D [Candidatus Bathyarchaeota archaeon]|nr:DNA-directed RNA polymerase subunit D [Candidatus Bathyarchaeota archaeon]HIJ08685.1 DNA-directed RNA polymerase subunit D [Candidatus Bathyarchaeota archaeon]
MECYTEVKIEIIEKDAMNLRISIKDVDVPLMNALRRIALAEVPSMAIDEVVMIENSAILQDEMVAHRLGLIPLRTDLDTYNLPEECSCKSEFGCPQCRVTLVLNAEAKEGTRTVYSGELISDNPEIVPVSDKIPIIKLAKGQKLNLEAYARLGKGKNHAKWQPVSMCAYKYYPKIEVPTDKCPECQKCVEICPKKVYTIKDDKLSVKDLLACNLCMDCVEACPTEPKRVKVEWDKNAFIMNIETNGVLPPERILQEATKILDRQLQDFEEQIKVE